MVDIWQVEVLTIRLRNSESKCLYQNGKVKSGYARPEIELTIPTSTAYLNRPPWTSSATNKIGPVPRLGPGSLSRGTGSIKVTGSWKKLQSYTLGYLSGCLPSQCWVIEEGQTRTPPSMVTYANSCPSISTIELCEIYDRVSPQSKMSCRAELLCT